MVPLYWIWTSTTTSIIKDFFVSENQYIGKLTILTTFFYYLCNANDIVYEKNINVYKSTHLRTAYNPDKLLKLYVRKCRKNIYGRSSIYIYFYEQIIV